ncbi:MAG TPA: DUF429 domain-containing protein [Thermoleophilia bacterium]|nr:DUF429 domain-containing protein [Thermoleophilia bacterium]
MSDPDLVIGIDVAAARPSTAVAVRAGRAAARGGRGGAAAPATVVEWIEADHRDPDQVAALMDWIGRHEPAVVAVDAPQGYRRPARGEASAGARPASAPAGSHPPLQRVCDRELMARRISLYPVPTRQAVASGESRLPEWMKAGFDYFRRLRRIGFEVPDQPVMPGALGGPPAALEVYPYGAFATLLGALPPSKATRAGLRLRIVALRRAGLEWDEYFDHDSLDALAAALTAWRFQQGRAAHLGDPAEGLIWLPVSPSEVLDTYTAS